MSEVVLIEDWRFDARSGELTRGDVTKRLEDRSSRTLALLCDSPGEVVPKQLIVETIWHGRHVSENSLAVVIADLRRAIGDDARNARFIETVAKRGYRIIAPVSEPPTETDDFQSASATPLPSGPAIADLPEGSTARPWRLRIAGAVVIAIVMALIALSMGISAQPNDQRVVVVGPVVNDTGRPALAPLAIALHELVLNRVASFPGVTVVDDGVAPPGSPIRLKTRLIIWNDTPTLSLSASDGSHDVLWSAMAVGEPDAIAGVAGGKLAELRRTLEGMRSRGP